MGGGALVGRTTQANLGRNFILGFVFIYSYMNLLERYDQLNFELMVVVASIAGSNWTVT